MTPQIKQRIDQLRRGKVPEGYKKTKIGIVPEEWEETIFSDLFTSTSDFTDNLNQYPLYSLTIGEGITAKTDRYERSHLVKKENAYKIVRPNDFAYNPMNVRFGAVARHKGTIDVCVSGYYDIFTTKDKSDLEFMDSFLISDKMIAYYNKISIGSLVEKQRVHFSQFMDFRLPLPSSTERKKIAEILSEQDKLIALKEKLIEEKKLQKKYLMQQLLTGKKRLPGFSGEWESRTIGSLGTFYGGLSAKTKEDFGCGESRYITFKNVINNTVIDIHSLDRVNVSDKEKQNLVCKGDLFFNLSSETPEELGMCAVLLNDIANTYLNSFCIGYRLTTDTVDPLFLAYLFDSFSGREIMSTLAQGVTRINLNKEGFKKKKVNIPCLAEQKGIITILSVKDQEIMLLQRTIDQEKQKKKALMQLLLSGVVRVNV